MNENETYFHIGVNRFLYIYYFNYFGDNNVDPFVYWNSDIPSTYWIADSIYNVVFPLKVISLTDTGVYR